MMRTLSLLVPTALVAVLMSVQPAPRVHAAEPAPMPRAKKARSAGALEYNRDIRPILAENCFACHGPDSAARKAEPPARPARRRHRGEGHRSRQARRERADQPHHVRGRRRDHAAAEVAQEAHGGAEGNAEEVDRGGRRVSAALVVHRADAADAARGEGQGVGPQPDRRLHPRRAGEARAEAGAGSGSPHARPPARARPHRPAARRRPTSRRSSTTSRRTAYEKFVDKLLAIAALGRAPRPVLARRRPLRRHARHPHRQLPRDLGVPRLGHQRLQQESAVRPVHDRATRRRPAAERRRSISASPPASTAATSRRAKAARSTRSTSSSTPATAPRRRRRSGWA